MTEPLQFDPRTRQKIKDALYDVLYGPIQKHFQERLDRIVTKNTLLGGFSHKSFVYKNEVYNCDRDPLPRKMNRLVPSLYPEMNDYLRDIKQLNEKELPFVLGYINQVLNASDTLPDYMRLLPEAVHGPVQHLIDTCPCRAHKLPVAAVQELQEKNQLSLDLIRQRMFTNLLI